MFTLANARTLVADHVDDENNRRWSTTKIDVALTRALSVCLRKVADWTNRLDLELPVTTSVTDGSAQLATFKPRKIKQCAVVISPTTWRIPPKATMRRGYTDATSRNLILLYVRDYRIPLDASLPLVGVDAVPALADGWPEFEQWICACAAQQLLVKDAEMRGSLDTLVAGLEADTKADGGSPKSRPMQRPEWSPIASLDISWQWVPGTQTIYTVRGT